MLRPRHNQLDHLSCSFFSKTGNTTHLHIPLLSFYWNIHLSAKSSCLLSWYKAPCYRCCYPRLPITFIHTQLLPINYHFHSYLASLHTPQQIGIRVTPVFTTRIHTVNVRTFLNPGMLRCSTILLPLNVSTFANPSAQKHLFLSLYSL